jgi:inhibitor of KinA sporulation pathway (predicted exonuclease)
MSGPNDGAAGTVVVDVEATCSRCRVVVPVHEMEIIELGAVLLDADGAVAGEFETFVRPVRHPRLTAFCTELTGIVQADVDAAPPFRQALAAFLAFAGDWGRLAFCSWGSFDHKILARDCAWHGIPVPAFATVRNLKHEFAAARRTHRGISIAQALQALGERFDGRPHRGLADARNVARVLHRLAATP